MKNASIAASTALSALLAFSAAAHANTREIPQSLMDRYAPSGEVIQSHQSESEPKAPESNIISTLRRVADGNMLKRSFADGNGEMKITGSLKGGGTIGFEVNLNF